MLTTVGTIIKKPQADYEVWESELSKFISQFYGRPYQIQQHQFDGQDTYRFLNVPDLEYAGNEYGLTVEEWLALPYEPGHEDFNLGYEGSKAQVNLHWIREVIVHHGTVMNDLYNKGIVPGGTYLILTWW